MELLVEQVFEWDKNTTARAVFGTDSENHPGVAAYLSKGEFLIGAQVTRVCGVELPFPEHSLSPQHTRTLFDERGLATVAGFQTRNAPHRGHEHLHKMAMALVDAVLIQPVIGKKKPGDFTDEAIVAAHEALLKHYYSPTRAIVATLPLEMVYAGPREAIHHAIVRKNFGCSHFIVGRDHAGVGEFYSPEAAIDIFDTIPDLGITILSFRGDFFYCAQCRDIASDRTCPHSTEMHTHFSGTTLRNALQQGEKLASELMRPEVVTALSGVASLLVE